MGTHLAKMKTLDAKAKKEEEAKKKAEEEKKKSSDEDDGAEYAADVESDHHGRIHVDYRLPRPNNFPQTYEFTREVKCGVGTFAEVFMCTMKSTGKIVAVKKIRQDKTYKSRELQIHKELHH